jgi:hypothetical protein
MPTLANHYGSPARIFLCHSSGDKAVVRELYRRLRSDGFDPWLDEEDLLPGMSWEDEIQKAVRASNVIIVCLSATAIGKAGYVQRRLRPRSMSQTNSRKARSSSFR